MSSALIKVSCTGGGFMYGIGARNEVAARAALSAVRSSVIGLIIPSEARDLLCHSYESLS